MEEDAQTTTVVRKERKALGSVMIESTEPFPEPPRDFWEGEQWEVLCSAAVVLGTSYSASERLPATRRSGLCL